MANMRGKSCDRSRAGGTDEGRPSVCHGGGGMTRKWLQPVHDVVTCTEDNTNSTTPSEKDSFFSGMEVVRAHHKQGTTSVSRTESNVAASECAFSLQAQEERFSPPERAPPCPRPLKTQEGSQASQKLKHLAQASSQHSEKTASRGENTTRTGFRYGEELFDADLSTHIVKPLQQWSNVSPGRADLFQEGGKYLMGTAFSFIASDLQKSGLDYDGTENAHANGCGRYRCGLDNVKSGGSDTTCGNERFVDEGGSCTCGTLKTQVVSEKEAQEGRASHSGKAFSLVDSFTSSADAHKTVIPVACNNLSGDLVCSVGSSDAEARESAKNDSKVGLEEELCAVEGPQTLRGHPRPERCVTSEEKAVALDDFSFEEEVGEKGGAYLNGETIWAKQRSELSERQEEVLRARFDYANNISTLQSSIERRCALMMELRELEERIDQCVSSESFDDAGLLENEVSRICAEIVAIDTSMSVVSFTEQHGRLHGAVQRLVQLLRRHRTDISDSLATEKRRLEHFINKRMCAMEKRAAGVALQLDEWELRRRNTQQTLEELRKCRSEVVETLKKKNEELCVSHQRVSREKIELDDEIALLEARLLELREVRENKAALLLDLADKMKRNDVEKDVLVKAHDEGIQNEEDILLSINTKMGALQRTIEAIREEGRLFEETKAQLLDELRQWEENIAIFDKQSALLEKETVPRLPGLVSAVTEVLQLWRIGIGAFCGPPHSVSASVSETPMESPVFAVRELERRLCELDVDSQQQDELLTSIDRQLSLAHGSLPLVEAAKQSAISLKQFSDAKTKSEEIRSLLHTIEELSASRQSLTEHLQENRSKYAALSEQLVVARNQSKEKVRAYITKYETALKTAAMLTTTPLDFLQLPDVHQGSCVNDSDELLNALQRLLHTLENECKTIVEKSADLIL
ncbi:hypothetical protein ERJ75_000066400 [Trypanosoma vivax]|nr:hypothetical protein TRVL_03646 [Trypanosoma vivax]KAH8620460.1 hypothetical protein ERJ75_000066400 [Trypanosoma vivax]